MSSWKSQMIVKPWGGFPSCNDGGACHIGCSIGDEWVNDIDDRHNDVEVRQGRLSVALSPNSSMCEVLMSKALSKYNKEVCRLSKQSSRSYASARSEGFAERSCAIPKSGTTIASSGLHWPAEKRKCEILEGIRHFANVDIMKAASVGGRSSIGDPLPSGLG